jgi:hypothetical protein
MKADGLNNKETIRQILHEVNIRKDLSQADIFNYFSMSVSLQWFCCFQA